MRRFMKKRVYVALTAVAALAIAGAAFAYFTSTGNGTGSATVGSATNWTVGQTGSPSGGPLYPDAAIGGANIQTNPYTVTNGGKGSQKLTSVILSVATSTGGTWTSSLVDATKPACTASDFSVGGSTVGAAWTDTALASDFTAAQSKIGHVTVEMIDNGANQDNCQGVTVPLYMAAS